MIVSKTYKFIFFHIPKTGGKSISDYIIRYGERVKGPHNFKCDEHRKFFRFGFIRNPWDRFVSKYFYFKNYGNKTCKNDIHSGQIVNRFETFNEFVKNFDSIFNELRSLHWQPQVKYIADRLDYIGRFETLQNDFDIICDKIGIPQQHLPHKNKGEHKHYTEYYDDETRAIVARKYTQDIEYFGYEFEP